MRLNEVVRLLSLKVYTPGVALDNVDVRWGYVSDLLSDVIANLSKGDLWITIQKHLNIIAVAKLKDAAGIIISKGLEPDPQTIEKAQSEGVILLGTQMDSFELSGKLYNLLKYGEAK